MERTCGHDAVTLIHRLIERFNQFFILLQFYARHCTPWEKIAPFYSCNKFVYFHPLAGFCLSSINKHYDMMPVLVNLQTACHCFRLRLLFVIKCAQWSTNVPLFHVLVTMYYREK